MDYKSLRLGNPSGPTRIYASLTPLRSVTVTLPALFLPGYYWDALFYFKTQATAMSGRVPISACFRPARQQRPKGCDIPVNELFCGFSKNYCWRPVKESLG